MQDQLSINHKIHWLKGQPPQKGRCIGYNTGERWIGPGLISPIYAYLVSHTKQKNQHKHYRLNPNIIYLNFSKSLSSIGDSFDSSSHSLLELAIAASAPILQFVGMTPCEKFGQLVTKDFTDQSKTCAEVIRKSWSVLNEVVKTGFTL
ncbi:hypothetical protein Avbf_00284 [Armadillidium vulgare]|nr:hypothetical protein Avbf_00284 [Armadillidium vulgare]